MQRFGAYLVRFGLSGIARHNTMVLATLAVVLVGCSPAKRKFDEVKHGSDAGDAYTKTHTDAGGSSGESTSGSSVETSSTHDEVAPCVNEGASSGCPADTECRKYDLRGCDEAGKPVCDATSVKAETPCSDGAGQCDGEGQCIVAELARLGESCEDNEQCGSGHCTAGQDGQKLCCDAACDGACTACGKDGHCDVTPTEDAECDELTCPESNECTVYPPRRAACAAFGECATTESYCEPEFTTASCGGGGTCDGSGTCCPKPGPERECTKECPCDTGGGVCTSDDQCLTGYVCTEDAIAKLGFPAASCLPAHCVNDKQDEGETSVDCGGGCGCRATYELVEITGVPDDARFSQISAMSGDGRSFAAIIGRSRASFPARLSANGVVTELQALGVTGGATAISADGAVIVGTLTCGDPPECTLSQSRPFRWINDRAPEAVPIDGSATAVSATGALVAGHRYDPVAEAQVVFRVTTQPVSIVTVRELGSAAAMSADGEFIVGQAANDDAGLLWSATQGVVPLNVPGDWSRWQIDVLSADGKVFSGFGYVAAEDQYRPYLWKDGEFKTLPMLPGMTFSIIEGISGDGSVIVGSNGNNAVQRAFIWTKTAGTQSVVAEVRERGVELPADLALVQTDFVSSDGRTLVGVDSAGDPPSFWRVTLLPDGEWLP